MLGVRLKDVSRTFGAFNAVDGIDLEIAPGSFVTLLGSSGCGKTTTLRMVAGLETNTRGTIAIGDTVVSDADRGLYLPPEQRGLGMVFQSYAIWPHMTVFENVAYPLEVRRMPKADIQKRVMETLRLVEMEHLASRPAPALSGGQQQRVAIARALVAQPSVLLLDEPLSNLDARLRRQMGAELRQLQQKANVTALYVTHDQDEAMALSDVVVLMQKGRILQVGSPRDIYNHPVERDVAAFFGTPNLVDSTVSDCVADKGGYLLTVENADWAGNCRAANPARAGDAVTVMIRGEFLSPSDGDGKPGDIAFDAIVEDTSFHGSVTAVNARLKSGGTVYFETRSTPPVKGDRVRLSVDPAQVWAMPAR